MRYIGVSRSVAQSLRLHLARMPELTYGFKVFHITRPSRVILEMTRQAWITELGAAPEVGGRAGLNKIRSNPQNWHGVVLKLPTISKCTG